jgi:hypothetical protein
MVGPHVAVLDSEVGEMVEVELRLRLTDEMVDRNCTLRHVVAQSLPTLDQQGVVVPIS